MTGSQSLTGAQWVMTEWDSDTMALVDQSQRDSVTPSGAQSVHRR